ncbi:hypothetical protein [Eisenbergiella porci]|uniref:hypothetical protein n=1 Tax=Eisenbergiella porci TaxID=2652274 RepID=UPI002A822A02|nr:hypothetical protein [Eisenbergiella porci]
MWTIRKNIVCKKEERGVHMEPEYDMEVTPERANTIKERLVQLLEDQMGCKLTVTVIDKGKEPA